MPMECGSLNSAQLPPNCYKGSSPICPSLNLWTPHPETDDIKGGRGGWGGVLFCDRILHPLVTGSLWVLCGTLRDSRTWIAKLHQVYVYIGLSAVARVASLTCYMQDVIVLVKLRDYFVSIGLFVFCGRFALFVDGLLLDKDVHVQDVGKSVSEIPK